MPTVRDSRCRYCYTVTRVDDVELLSHGCPVCGGCYPGSTLRIVDDQPAWTRSFDDIRPLVQEARSDGSGMSYQAEEPSLWHPRWLTIRELSPDRCVPGGAEKLRRELLSLRSLQHPHLWPVLDVGLHDDRLYVAGPAVSGHALCDLVARQRLDVLQAVGLVQQLAEGLAAIHGQGLVHRDLRLSSILVTEAGRALLLDTGTPRRRTAGGQLVTQGGAVIGTVAYLAPEQAAGNGPIDPRSDIYSLGVILFELLTGWLPFRGSLGGILKQILTMRAPAPSTINEVVPWELDVICQRCLARTPAERYPDADALAADLARMAEHLA